MIPSFVYPVSRLLHFADVFRDSNGEKSAQCCDIYSDIIAGIANLFGSWRRLLLTNYGSTEYDILYGYSRYVPMKGTTIREFFAYPLSSDPIFILISVQDVRRVIYRLSTYKVSSVYYTF